jgi:hypothetical protein
MTENSKNKVYASLDPLWKAMSKMKRRRYDEAANICSSILEKNPRDKVNRARRFSDKRKHTLQYTNRLYGF